MRKTNKPTENKPLERLSVVIPARDEAGCIAATIQHLHLELNLNAIPHEIVVVDDGSTDETWSILQSLKNSVPTLAPVQNNTGQHGFGRAIIHGIDHSTGDAIVIMMADQSDDTRDVVRYWNLLNEGWECVFGSRFIIMGDADDSYDFLESARFVEALRQGADLAQGCRFARGGGKIMPGAMPFLHRYFGNPVLSWLVRWMFRIQVNDVYCGLRGFTRDLYNRLDLRSPGMEFATEMIIRTGTLRAKIAEVPITLHPDGRRSHGPHLRTFRDGWRTLRLFLVFSPRWTFFFPGCMFLLLALIGYLLAIPQVTLAGIIIDVHTLLIASLAALLGWQSILLAVLARIFAGREGMLPRYEKLEQVTVEQGLVAGVAGGVLGIGLIAMVIVHWWQANFGPLDYPKTMRLVIPGVTFVALGFQTVMASLFAGVLRMHRERGGPVTVSRNETHLGQG